MKGDETITPEEADFLVTILDQIQIPLKASDGIRSYTLGHNIRKKLLKLAKDDKRRSDDRLGSQ